MKRRPPYFVFAIVGASVGAALLPIPAHGIVNIVTWTVVAFLSGGLLYKLMPF